MGNYFTTPKVMEITRSLCVGAVGTARAQQGWPPKEIKTVKDESFNMLYFHEDTASYVIARWIENNLVTIVSTKYKGFETEV